MLSATKIIPDAVGNGSSTTVFAEWGRIVYNPTVIATTAMMIKIIIVFFSFTLIPLRTIGLTVLRHQIVQIKINLEIYERILSSVRIS